MAPLSAAGAVLLDLDGTLVDSEPVHRAAYQALFDDRGWQVDEATYRGFVGRRGADAFASVPGPWAGEDPEALVAEVLGHLARGGELPVEARGARRLVHEVHAAGVPLALVTSATLEWAELALGQVLGVHERFDAVVTWTDVPHGKPHPGPYELACRRLGVQAARAVAVEDSVAGVTSAVAAGVGHVVAVTSTSPAADLRAAGAHVVVEHLEQLLDDPAGQPGSRRAAST